MDVVGLDPETQMSVLQIVAGILHLGNITFRENGNRVVVEDKDCKLEVGKKDGGFEIEDQIQVHQLLAERWQGGIGMHQL